jgi:hypothetical protein
MSKPSLGLNHSLAKATREAIAPVESKLSYIEELLSGLVQQGGQQEDRRQLLKAYTGSTTIGDESDGTNNERYDDDPIAGGQGDLVTPPPTPPASMVTVDSAHWSLNVDEKLEGSCDLRSLSYSDKAVAKAMKWADWWKRLKEPDRKGRLAEVADSKRFESLCATVILINAVFTLLVTNWEMNNLGEEPTTFMFVAELFFLIFYLLELVLKIQVHRFYFFLGADARWNVFDLFLVVFSVYDQLISKAFSQAGENGGGLNLTFMRSFRVFKMAKILRAVRAMRFISDLRLMLNSIIGSFTSLFWSFVMLSFIFYIFSLIFVQGFITYLLEEKDDMDPAALARVMKYFGSVEASILTLIQATTGGNDWGMFYDTVSMSGTINSALFIFFIGFFHVALLNVLTGVFVEHAMELAKPDPYALALEQRKRELEEAEELRQACHSLHTVRKSTRNGMGTYITSDDFEREILHGPLRAHLRVLGLDIKDARSFYGILAAANGGKDVEIDTFVSECMKLKGFATAIDMQNMMCEHRESIKDVRKLVAREMRKSGCAKSGPGDMHSIRHEDCQAASPRPSKDSDCGPSFSSVEASEDFQRRIVEESALVAYKKFLELKAEHEDKGFSL